MTSLKYISFALLLMVMTSASALAGDYAHFHFIGFSRAGTYLAFEEYGINDTVEDSSAYSVIYIVDVARNSYATVPFKANGDKSPYDENDQYDADKIETEVRYRNIRRARQALRRFGIVDGNTGLQVVAHLINEYEVGDQTALLPQKDGPAASDTNAAAESNDAYLIPPSLNANSRSNSNSAIPNNNTAGSDLTNANTATPAEPKHDPMGDYVSYLPQEVAFTKRGNALYRDGNYELKIKPVPVTQKNCDEYERDMFSFDLTLKNERNEIKILEKGGAVPRGRGCTDGYGIQEAFLYHGKLAVFIGIFTRGWEGENLRLMAVTGELND